MEELIIEENMRWDEQKVNNLFGEQTTKQIMEMRLSTIPKENSLIWAGSKMGPYIVKEAYNSMQPAIHQQNPNQASSSYQIPTSTWNNIWRPKHPAKSQIFLMEFVPEQLTYPRESMQKKAHTRPPLSLLSSMAGNHRTFIPTL